MKNYFCLVLKMSKRKTKAKKEGNLYDKILKENAQASFIALTARQLGFEIAKYERLTEKTQTTLEREADLLAVVETKDGQKFILHIEFQVKNDNQMLYRQAEYHGIELRKYQMPIRHVVIYLGKDSPKMPTQLKKEEIFSGFELIEIHKIDVHKLLASQVPEDIVLAILAHFDRKNAEAIIRLLLKNLKAACKSENLLNKYINQLKVLGKLRNLDSLIHKMINTMPVYIDITNDSFYLQGLAKGREEIKESKLQAIKNLLKNNVDIKIIAKSFGVTQKYVKQIQKEMSEEK